MFERLGRVAYRRRWVVLVAALAFLAVAGAWGTGVFGRLTGAGFEDPGSESARATAVAAAHLGRDDADVVVLYRSADRTVEDPAYRRAVTATLAALPADAVERTVSWYGTNAPGLVSQDRHATYAVLTLRGNEEQRTDALRRIEPQLAAPGLQTSVGGTTTVGRDINERVSADIARAETLSMPILLGLLVLVFGSVVAAGLPLAIGGIAILGAFTALRVVSLFTEVSVFAVNVVTILGLGLAIDYGLFVVSRFREELARGLTPPDAIARTMATAGRTVAVSGAHGRGLAVRPADLPAGLPALDGCRRDGRRAGGGGGRAHRAAGAAGRARPAGGGAAGPPAPAPRRRRSPTAGMFARLARSVMRRPVLYAVGVVAVLLALGLPFLRVTFGGIDARALPAATESRHGRRDASTATSRPTPPARCRLWSPPTRPRWRPGLGAGPHRPRRHLGRRSSPSGTVGPGRLGFAGDPMSAGARAVLQRVRDLPPPAGGERAGRRGEPRRWPTCSPAWGACCRGWP